MVNTLLSVSLLIIALSFILIVIRFLIGTTIADRIIALDVLTVSSIGMLVILAQMFERVIYLDVAIVYGILSFIGVIVMAKYMEKSL
ncbi:MAG: monovalent cation/H+ antiporter complex subunit F [Bacteroidota bacterium]|nr:monovalent cation/H+ antiporter complex subunit F [Bacteroidota bacterium]